KASPSQMMAGRSGAKAAQRSIHVDKSMRPSVAATRARRKPDILKKLETVLSRSTYTGGVVRKDIPHERYAEFYYQIEQTDNFFLISIVYWFF
ncbi:MAG: hypothetical protein VCC99_02015, partial [Alphaproteobacteria bacterium]